jgi:dTDP-4-dehydrorhamnose 3,5-epimerase
LKHTIGPLSLDIFEPKIFGDNRGFFYESWNELRYAKMGLKAHFIQDNISHSSKGVLRGLHYQYPHPQGKLVSVLDGEIFDVVVDLRIGSPYFGKSAGIVLDGISKKQLFVPEGFAHGFLVLSETATFLYKCTRLYEPAYEHTLLWNDPALDISWPSLNLPLLVSSKDVSGLSLQALINEKKLPLYFP